MANNNGTVSRTMSSLMAGLLIAAIVGLIVLYGTVKANCARLDKVEPNVTAMAKDITEIKADTAAIRAVVEYQKDKE